jgi:thioredoxin-dependent peroxiredoxin
MVKEGEKAPDFELSSDTAGKIKLSKLKGQVVVLFFYPKDDTSGCTKEAIGFSQSLADFTGVGVEVLGVSPDSLAKHTKFREKHELTVTLLSDEEKKVLEAYGAWVEKSMYGRKYMGVERSTFLIGKDGKIARIWRKVKVAGHVEAVLAAVKAL